MPAATRSTMRVVGDAIKRRLSRGRSLRRSDTHLRRRASSQLVATTNRPKSERGSSAHHSHQHGLRREAMLRGSSPYVLHRTGGTSKHGAHDNLDDVYPKFKVEGSTRTRKPRVGTLDYRCWYGQFFLSTYSVTIFDARSLLQHANDDDVVIYILWVSISFRLEILSNWAVKQPVN